MTNCPNCGSPALDEDGCITCSPEGADYALYGKVGPRMTAWIAKNDQIPKDPAPSSSRWVAATAIDLCLDYWHCDPALAAHSCTTKIGAADRTKPCPSCGAPPQKEP